MFTALHYYFIFIFSYNFSENVTFFVNVNIVTNDFHQAINYIIRQEF